MHPAFWALRLKTRSRRLWSAARRSHTSLGSQKTELFTSDIPVLVLVPFSARFLMARRAVSPLIRFWSLNNMQSTILPRRWRRYSVHTHILTNYTEITPND